MDKDKDLNFNWLSLVKAYWYFANGFRISLFFWLTLLFLMFFYTLVPAFIIGKVVDFFVYYKQGSSLNTFYFYIFFLGFSYTIVSMARLYSKYNLSKISIQVKYLARVKGFEKLLNFSLKWHDKENSGEKTQRIQTGTNALSQGLSLFKNDLLPVFTSVVGVFFVFLFMNFMYAFLVFLYLLTFVMLQLYFYNKIQRLNNVKYAAIEKASGTYQEGLSNILTIKTLGAQDTF